MVEYIFITDLDLENQKGAGIALYVKNLMDCMSEMKTVLIGKNIAKKNFKSSKEITVGKANSNIVHLLKLFFLKKDFISSDSIIVSQRPDFIVPFKKFKNRKIVTVHGNPNDIIKSKKSYFVWKLYSFFEKKGMKMADKIIFIDSNSRESYENKYPFISTKAITIPPGINLKNFKVKSKQDARKKKGFSKNLKIMLFVGRLEKEKNVDSIISEFNKFKKKNYRLLIIGNGREGDKLRKMESDDIHFLGELPNDDIVDYMNIADSLVLMSESEGLPTVILEGFACGLPVIATNVGDICKLVENGKTGFISELSSLGRNFEKTLKKDYSKNCIIKVKEYNWDMIVNKLLKVYNEK